MMTNETSLQQNIPERIDRLPVNWVIVRIMLLAGIAWFIESYDIGIIGNALPLINKHYPLNAFSQGWLVAASTLGIVVAIVPASWIADQFGRKRVLIFGTAWYAVFSFLCGLATNIPLLFALRLISGFGMGAVFPIPYAIASEYMPRRLRGAMTGILDSFLSFGYFLAPVLALLIVPAFPVDSWRYLFYIGGLPLLFVPVLIFAMPESARWLQSKGRHASANRIVSALEEYIERRTGKKLPEPERETAVVITEKVVPVGMIFRGAYLKRTLMMWIAFSCILFLFYAIQTYTPTVLIKEGYAVKNAFLVTAIIVLASIPGKYAETFVVERWGRKPTILLFTIVACLSAVLFGSTGTLTKALGLPHIAFLGLASGIILSFFGIGVDPALKIYGAEQYPTRVRETGVGFIEGIGRFLGGALAPFIMSFILSTGGGIPRAYIFVAVVGLVGVAAVALLGSETKGEILEKVSEIAQKKELDGATVSATVSSAEPENG
ncbi:MFS transporter [Ktedonosporobacter rubrisoli]|nr:MFS transporter [Ktedonosporobacter rubrisoli]